MNTSSASAAGQFRRHLSRSFSARSLLLLSTSTALTVGITALTGAVDSSSDPAALTFTEVQPSTFRWQVEMPGVIEPLHSAAVHSECYWNCRILSLVPEGTWVQKGDVVCVLDSADIEEFARAREVLLIKYRSRLDNALQDQELQQSQNERRLTAAQFKYETATRQLEEYRDGTFPQQLEELERNLAILSDQAMAAEDEVRHTERLWVMGMVNRSEMERGSLDLHKAQQKYDQLEAKLRLLTEFSHPRSTLQLEHTATNAERNVARTRMTNELSMTRARLTTLSYERTLRIYERYYRRAVDSIKACTLRAPCDGQIVHANPWYLRSRGITRIEEGANVRRLQKVFEIPDPSRLKVSVPLNESLIFRVSKGLPVTVTLPGYDDIEVAGRIINISRYPRVRSRYTPHLKDYWLDVELLPTDEQRELLKPRGDVIVSMTLSEIPNALQIRRDAITGLAGHNFVYVYNGDSLESRKVELGEANDEYVCVTAGLEAGDQLVTDMLPAHKQALDRELRRDLGLIE
ncbi:MAG: HlyD family efflux transporter periplasmic adaptor subunit [Fuerstiella sp.]